MYALLRFFMGLTISTVLSFQCEAQIRIDPSYDKASIGKRWNISLSRNIVFAGPGKDMVDYLEANNFGHRRPRGTLVILPFLAFEINSKDFPVHSRSNVWMGEVGYNISRRSGVVLIAGEFHQAYAQGFHRFREDIDPYKTGILLGWRSYLWGGSVNYKWRFGKGVSGFHAGPLLARHSMNGSQIDETFVPEGENPKAWIAGVNFGATLGFKPTKNLFLAVKTHYLLLPDRSIGPFTIRREDPAMIEREFGHTSLSLSDLHLGLAMGWCIGSKAGSDNKQP